jgi:hypothetical protein
MHTETSERSSIRLQLPLFRISVVSGDAAQRYVHKAGQSHSNIERFALCLEGLRTLCCAVVMRETGVRVRLFSTDSRQRASMSARRLPRLLRASGRLRALACSYGRGGS